MLDADLVPRTRRSRQSGVLQTAGSFSFVVFTEPVSMRAVVRNRTERFTTTVGREAASLDVVVDGNCFDATDAGKFDALIGHDPVSASETLIEGRVVEAGHPTLGDSRPQRFFIADDRGTGRRRQARAPSRRDRDRQPARRR